VSVLQAEDDAERVREAVTRTLAVGLLSEDFSMDLNDWLNPTEVRMQGLQNPVLFES